MAEVGLVATIAVDATALAQGAVSTYFVRRLGDFRQPGVAYVLYWLKPRLACYTSPRLFGRKWTLGIQSLIAGIAVAHRDDQTRLERGSAVFDDLYEFFKRR